jgi:integrase
LFEFAVKRGWCQQNAVNEVAKAKAHPSAVGILNPEQYSKILEEASEQTLPYWLLGGFAGLRRAEIERLEWKDIRFDLGKYAAFLQASKGGEEPEDSKVKKQAVESAERARKDWRESALIEVPALKAKTASRRFVPIQDNLAAWLEPYIGRTGKVCPPNLRKLLETDRANADLKSWASNALRHGFASYHLAKFKNAAMLALELGHTDQKLIFRHYRELVKPEEAEKYWNLFPARTLENVVPMAQAS